MFKMQVNIYFTLQMDSDEEAALSVIIVATFTENIKREKGRRRKEWVKLWLQRRNSHGFHSWLLRELGLEEQVFVILLHQIQTFFCFSVF